METITNTTSILLIYTGGTIGMIENPVTGALENFSFERSTNPWTRRIWMLLRGVCW